MDSLTDRLKKLATFMYTQNGHTTKERWNWWFNNLKKCYYSAPPDIKAKMFDDFEKFKGWE